MYIGGGGGGSGRVILFITKKQVELIKKKINRKPTI
jgi:hypothetical protein